jgi:ADP-dependent NAD(P)H-hydrate dehydratase / NAD(P)H-hydrate epimerase
MRLPPKETRVVTAGEMAAMDQAAISEHGIPALALMERAGREAARFIAAWWRGTGSPESRRPTRRTGGARPRPSGGPVLVLAGRGNNGGDGFVCARYLKTSGFVVRVLVAAAESDLSEAAQANCEACQRAKIPVTFLSDPRAWGPGSEAESATHMAAFLIDALLGTGSRGAPRGAIASAIELAERSHKPIASIDIPSGLDASTGHRMQPSIAADLTVSLALPKRGLALEPGRSAAGQVAVVDIGIPAGVIAQAVPSMLVATAEWARALLPARPSDAHKGSMGRVLVVGGSAGLMGAIGMAAESALRSGAGYALAAVPRSGVDIVEARAPEVVKRGCPETAERSLSGDSLGMILAESIRADVIAIGPGLSRNPESAELVRALLEQIDGPIVLDADGLNAFEGVGVRRRRGPLILTPHYGEAARLTGSTVAEVARDPAGWARKVADESGAIVCMKSTPMVTAAPGEPAILNATGNPGMATAGAGDVLTGAIAGLLAQGLDPGEAAALGCYVHGLAGDVAARRSGLRGMIAGDIMRALPAALLALESGALDGA